MRTSGPSRAAALVGLMAVACGTTAPRSTGRRAAGSTDAVEITVRHLPGEDAWSVEYRLPRPVHAVRFWSVYPPRRLEWTVAAPRSLSVWSDGDTDLLQRADRAPFDSFALRVPNSGSRPEKTHRLVVPYSDGGRLVFTGHFEVVPLACDSPAPCPGDQLTDEALPTRFTLIPRPAERTVAPRPMRGNAPSPVGSGSYAYFGSNRAARSPHMMTVLDRALPRWLLERVEALLPRLVALYAKRTKQTLRARPLVFLSYEEAPVSRGVDIAGGARSGAVQIHIRLGAMNRRRDDRTAREELAINLAHEIAHLWDAQLFEREGLRDSSWLHEGGAEAFAYRALLELQEIDAVRYRQRLSRAASLCAAGLGGRALTASSARPGHADEFYTCGLLIGTLSEAAAPRDDIFGLWAKIFSAAQGGRYDEALYWRTLDAAAGSPAPGAALRMLVYEPQEDSQAFIVEQMRRAGAELELADDGPLVDFRGLALRRMFGALAEADCGADVQLVSAGPGRIRVATSGRCRNLAANDVVSGVAGYDLDAGWAAAYDDVRERCARGETIRLVTDRPYALPIRCDAQLPARPQYLGIVRWPPIA